MCGARHVAVHRLPSCHEAELAGWWLTVNQGGGLALPLKRLGYHYQSRRYDAHLDV
jgi:hypothetical protein